MSIVDSHPPGLPDFSPPAPAARSWGIVFTTIFGYLILEISFASQWAVRSPVLRPLQDKVHQMEAQEPALSAETVREVVYAFFEANHFDLVALVSNITLAFIMVILTLLFASIKGAHALRQYLAFRPVSPRAVALGIGIIILYFICNTVANYHFAVQVTSESFREAVIPELVVEAVYTSPIWMQVVSLVLILPAAEEVFFRGFLMQGYLGTAPSKLRIAMAILATSAIYGLIHFHYSPVLMVQISGLGLILGLARVWSGSLLLPVVMHVANNGCSVLVGVWFSASKSVPEAHYFRSCT